MSGPSRRTRTHWTTGSDVPARQATRALPTRRVSDSRVLGSKLRIWTRPGRRSLRGPRVGDLDAGGLGAARGELGEDRRRVPARLRLEQVEHLPALGARAGQPAREQERQAEEDEDPR